MMINTDQIVAKTFDFKKKKIDNLAASRIEDISIGMQIAKKKKKD